MDFTGMEALDDQTIVVLYRGRTKGLLCYEDAFLLDATLIVSVSIPAQISSKAGVMNERLRLGQELEFLCRLLEKEEQCLIRSFAHEGMDDPGEYYRGDVGLDLEEYALLYAYLIRYHMNQLKKRGTLDGVFQGVCDLMRRKGCFASFKRDLDAFLAEEEFYESYAGMTAPYLVLRGDDTCGGVLRQFANDLAKSLEETGQTVVLYDGSEKDLSLEMLQGRIWKGIVGFQALALEAPFFHDLHGPKFQFWFDNPFSFQKVLRNLPKEYFVLCQDGDHAEWIKQYYHTNAIWFPPGGMEGLKNNASRDMGLVFIGSYFPDEPERLTKEQKAFYEFLLQNPSLDFVSAAKKVLGQHDSANDEVKTGVEFSLEDEEEALPNYLYAMKPACRAVIGHFRIAVVETILSAGIPMHVYGEGWNAYSGKGKELLSIHPEISVEESLRVLQRAKLGLNVMSWYKAGMTERVANIMLSGAVCISDETAYLREHARDGEDILCFRLEELEKLPDRIKRLLRDEKERSRIAENAHKIAKEHFGWDAKAKELIQISESLIAPKETLRIYVATHVPFQPPVNPIYVPLHVGRKGKQDLGYLGDDTGQNISDLNDLYGELTGLFWIWQNDQDADYIGLCHYRRYFINEKKQAMRQEEYMNLLAACDAIVPKHMECEGGCSYYEHFGLSHNKRDLDAVEHALKRLYPEYAPYYDKAMQGNIYYWGNLVVTHTAILKAYAMWLFTIFSEAGEEINVDGYDAYHRRVYGFLSEQMFYVFAMANDLKLCEVPVGLSTEKAETKELILRIRQLLLEAGEGEALQLLEKELKERPDLLLAGSDTSGELRNLCELLHYDWKNGEG